MPKLLQEGRGVGVGPKKRSRVDEGGLRLSRDSHYRRVRREWGEKGQAAADLYDDVA